MSESIAPAKRPIFLRVSTGLLFASIVCQVYFFAVLNSILDKKLTATNVLFAIIEWIYLVGPSFMMALVFYCLSLLCSAVSFFRKESAGSGKWYLLGASIVDLLIFIYITNTYYD